MTVQDMTLVHPAHLWFGKGVRLFKANPARAIG